MSCVDIDGKNASSISAKRTVATVVGPPNVPAIAAFSGCIKSLKTFFAYNFSHHMAPAEREQRNCKWKNKTFSSNLFDRT